MFGRDGTLRHANRAALALHEVREQVELDETAEDYGRTFEWRDPKGNASLLRQQSVERLMAGEPFTDTTVQLLQEAEDNRFFRYGGLLLPDNERKPDCRVLVLEDVTAEHEAEARFEQTFSANPAPAITCCLEDLRYIKVDRGFLEMTGFRREELIGRTVREVDILPGVKSRELALERLHSAQTIPQMEASLETKESGTKFVIVAGQPLEIHGGPCTRFFIDLAVRRKAEDAPRQGEKRMIEA